MDKVETPSLEVMDAQKDEIKICLTLIPQHN